MVTQEELEGLHKALENAAPQAPLYEATYVSLKPGDVLFIKIKSDYIDEETINNFKQSLQGKFGDNEVVVIGLAREDDAEISVISKE